MITAQDVGKLYGARSKTDGVSGIRLLASKGLYGFKDGEDLIDKVFDKSSSYPHNELFHERGLPFLFIDHDLTLDEQTEIILKAENDLDRQIGKRS